MKAATIAMIVIVCLMGAIAPAHAQTEAPRVNLVARALKFVSETGNGETEPALRVEIGEKFFVEAIATPDIDDTDAITVTDPYTVSIEYDDNRLEWYNATLGGDRWTETPINGRNTFTVYSSNWIAGGNVARLRTQLHFIVELSHDRSPLRFTVRTKDRTRNLTVQYAGDPFVQYMPLIRHAG